MHIDIVMDDLKSLMSCNDTLTVVSQQYYDSEKSLHNKKNIISIKGDVTEFAEIEIIVEKFKNSQCKALVIAYSNSPIKLNPAFSIDFVTAFVNHGEFDKILENPDQYFLEKIIVQVSKEENINDISHVTQ